jgi:hypothetical protein
MAKIGRPKIKAKDILVIACSTRQLNDEHLGDVVESALAAANAAADKHEDRWRTWAALRGGAHCKGDSVTEWICRAVAWECRTP